MGDQISRLIGSLLFLFFLTGALPGYGAEPAWEEVDRISWPTGFRIDGVELKGLSGIAYDEETKLFYFISDAKEPGAAHVFTLSLELDETGMARANWRGSQSLLQPNGDPFPPIDAEGIAFDHVNRLLYVSTEGFYQGHHRLTRDPWVGQFSWPEARLQRFLPLPADFLPRNENGEPVPPGAPSQKTGVRRNLGLEALGVTPDHGVVYAANEAALRQDYDGEYDFRRRQPQETLVRVVRFTGLPDRPEKESQRVYRTDPGVRILFLRAMNTLSALHPLDNEGTLLFLERGVQGPRLATGNFRIRIYQVDYFDSEATPVQSGDRLAGKDVTPLRKTLVWEGDEDMDNIEGLTRGPKWAGSRTLFLISDNNHHARQKTQLVMLREVSSPE